MSLQQFLIHPTQPCSLCWKSLNLSSSFHGWYYVHALLLPFEESAFSFEVFGFAIEVAIIILLIVFTFALGVVVISLMFLNVLVSFIVISNIVYIEIGTKVKNLYLTKMIFFFNTKMFLNLFHCEVLHRAHKFFDESLQFWRSFIVTVPTCNASEMVILTSFSLLKITCDSCT